MTGRYPTCAHPSHAAETAAAAMGRAQIGTMAWSGPLRSTKHDGRGAEPVSLSTGSTEELFVSAGSIRR